MPGFDIFIFEAGLWVSSRGIADVNLKACETTEIGISLPLKALCVYLDEREDLRSFTAATVMMMPICRQFTYHTTPTRALALQSAQRGEPWPLAGTGSIGTVEGFADGRAPAAKAGCKKSRKGRCKTEIQNAA